MSRTLQASPVSSSTASSMSLSFLRWVMSQSSSSFPESSSSRLLFPGFPEPAAEDSAKGDALFIDVGGDVDLGRAAGVSDGDDGGFSAHGFEQSGQGTGCSGAFEGDVEPATAAGEFAAALHDAVVGVQGGRAELLAWARR